MKKLLLLLVPVFAGLLSGCASPGLLKAYPGPERPADQIATIVLPASIEVRSINGEKQPRITTTLLKPVYSIITLPGEQEWSLRYYAPLAGGYYDQRNEVTESPWTSFQFKAEAGSVYHLHAEVPRGDNQLSDFSSKVRFSLIAETQQAEPVPAASGSATRNPGKLVEPAPALVVPPAATQAKVATPQTLEFAAFEQLKSWWTVAGPRERQAFRAWLKVQPDK
jgi:uncharacterized protein YccT (UPF0319 family)